MKRKLSFFVVLFLCAQVARAQFEIGISGGYNNNYLHTSTGYRAFTKYDHQPGFVVGIPLQYHFNDWLAIEADPSYIQKNYKESRDHFFDGIYQKNTNSYIQLPVMAHFSFGGSELKGFFNAGGYGAYWAGGRIKGAMANVFDIAPDLPNDQQVYNFFQFDQAYHYDEKYTFDSRRDRRMEFGLLAGAGIEYWWKQQYRFFIEARYYYGLSDQQKNYMINQIPRYNDTYVIQAGCLFNIRNIFHGVSAE